MRIALNRIDDAYHMEAVNEDGRKIEIDGSPDIGGKNNGMRPMQLLLAGIGGCSAIDVINILQKQRQELKDIAVIVDGERKEEEVPSVFKSIHLHFKLTGQVAEAKVKRALDLSINQYCSVAMMLGKTAEIDYSYEIIN